MAYSVYELVWLFLIYAFLGWCCEIGFCGVTEGHFVNRGFLNGPWCPIYGFGGVLIVLCLTPVAGNVLLLFLGSMLVCSAIELATGWALEKIYHARWWDYSDKKFNVGGYICLSFSVLWGFFGIFLMKLLHPFVYGLVGHTDNMIGYVAMAFVGAVFIADLIITLMTAKKLINRLRKMEELQDKIQDVTERIARNVYGMAVKIDKTGKEIYNSEDVQEFIDRTQTFSRVTQKRIDWEIAEYKAEHEDELEEFAERIDALRRKYAELRDNHDDDMDELKKKLASLKERHKNAADGKSILTKRMLEAFPHMRRRENKSLELLRERIGARKSRKKSVK